jgi:hypothetical protein
LYRAVKPVKSRRKKMTKEFGDSVEGSDWTVPLPKLPKLSDSSSMKKQHSSILLCIFLTFLA